MPRWKKLPKKEIDRRIFAALSNNINFKDELIMGVPGSHLDPEVFFQQASFLQDAPFLTTLIRNPNHIGCHTLGHSEEFTKGTQEIELEVVDICAQEILRGGSEDFDGYVASGGTESNIQAIWIYRNYFSAEFGAKNNEIAILCSEDTHYSMDKAADLLAISIVKIPVDHLQRRVRKDLLEDTLQDCEKKGITHFIVVVNMMTTIYGSVDHTSDYTETLSKHNLKYRVHVDAAYGGFFFPFTDVDNHLDFSNPEITSVTLDAHKMVQAPYGTGVFLIRKGFIQYANTKEATYVAGEDYTLIGSRSGANAVAIWMIFMTYGRYGWEEKIMILLKRAGWLSDKLKKAGIKAYRNSYSNIISIQSEFVSKEIEKKYGLIPDNHDRPSCYKIVVMDHVTVDKLSLVLEDLIAFQTQNLSLIN